MFSDVSKLLSLSLDPQDVGFGISELCEGQILLNGLLRVENELSGGKIVLGSELVLDDLAAWFLLFRLLLLLIALRGLGNAGLGGGGHQLFVDVTFDVSDA